MPRSLVSLWKRVATSGTTADGREILPQELRDAAETYQPSRYTAVIWSEHEREPGSHGTVYAARLVDDADDLEPGQVALEAQIKPNDKLLWLNDRGEKLFTSVEITPNFAGSGKAYLTGLAVTDSPASLGTQELYFSRKTNKTAYYTASVELGQLTENAPQGELGKLISMVTSLFKRLGLEESPAPPQSPTESNPPMDEARAKALTALVEQLLLVAAGIQTLINSENIDVEPEQEPIDNVEEAVQDILDTAEEEREFSRRRKKAGSSTMALERAVANLDKKFSALLDTPKGRTIPRTTGASHSQKRRVV